MDLQNQLNARDVPWIIPIDFRTEYETHERTVKEMVIVEIDGKNVPKEIERVVVETVAKDWVTVVQKGQSSGNAPPSWSDKVARLMKDTVMRPIIEPAYNAWKAGQEVPLDGTPLDVWAALNPAQIKIMRNFNVRTVEDFATAPSNVIDRMNLPGLRQLQARAMRRLEADATAQESGVQAKYEAEIAAREAEIASLKGDMESMKAQIAALAAKRGPGRARNPVEPQEEAA